MTIVAQPEHTPAPPMKVHTVAGGGGLRLHVREMRPYTAPDGPTITALRRLRDAPVLRIRDGALG
jgi:hypothetical protein